MRKLVSLAALALSLTLSGVLRAVEATPPTGSASADAATPPSLPPELAVLHGQFLKAQAEQVQAPFEAGRTKLNTAYLANLDKAIAMLEAKVAAFGGPDSPGASKTDGQGISPNYLIEILTDEKAMMAAASPPYIGRGNCPTVLSDMRGLYLEAHAKLEAARRDKLIELGKRFDTALRPMESSFAKSRRAADAQTVRDYRAILTGSLAGRKVEQSPLPSAQRLPTTLNPADLLALKDGFTNRIGMKFVPVPGTTVLFCIHETRLRDYAAYAADVPYVRRGRAHLTGEAYLRSLFQFDPSDKRTSWEDQSVDGYTPQENRADHPVVKLRWHHMQAFCNWLSRKEDRTYRLPTDREWSIAVGLGDREEWREGMYSFQIRKDQEIFPWGSEWPPSTKVGNYANQNTQDKPQFLIGYDDGYPTTAPVMSFAPNQFGLYDMGGNVVEATEDWRSSAKSAHIYRGGSWRNVYRGELLSSNRDAFAESSSGPSSGFRVVLSLHGD